MPGIEINGTTLEYEERGSGHAVVFVHGVFNDRRLWRGQMDAFASRYRAVAPSCRGHHPGERDTAGDDRPLETHARDLTELLRRPTGRCWDFWSRSGAGVPRGLTRTPAASD